MAELPKYGEIPKDVRKKSTLRGVIYAAILIVFFIFIELSIYMLVSDRIHKSLDQEYEFKTTQLAERFESLLNQLKIEFQIFANSEIALKCLQATESKACDNAASLMKTMAESNDNMDHIRIIDAKGREVVRVIRQSEGDARIVDRVDLQSRRHRSYFNAALATGGKEIYISRFELSTENGKVQVPHKPILRFGKSIRKANGEVVGIAIANYRVTSLLREINSLMTESDGHLYLLNEQGYYLQGVTPKHEYTFMFPDQYPVGFFSDHPTEWNAFTKDFNNISKNSNGAFFFREIRVTRIPNAVSPEKSLILVIHVPRNIRSSATAALTFGLAIGALLLLPLIALLGWKNGRYHVWQHWYIGELTNRSFTDDLTGVLNHRGVMKKLTPVIAASNRENTPFVLVFVDINDLKIFNDRMGHEMGDRLIQTAAHAMLQAVRKSDVVGRLGGDEFVLGLVDCNTPMAISVMQRVEQMLDEAGMSTTGSPWTMSWGYTEREADDTPEQMIARADQRMYRQKTAYKTGGHKALNFAEKTETDKDSPPQAQT